MTGENGWAAAGLQHKPEGRGQKPRTPAGTQLDLLCDPGKFSFLSGLVSPTKRGPRLLPLPLCESYQCHPLLSPAEAEGKPATWWLLGECLWAWNLLTG